LTGIRNKTAYDNETKRLQAMIELGEKKIGIAVIDLNYLKKINDLYGHENGNMAIQKLCVLICSIFAHSPVFRIGGDEFTVILRGVDYDQYDFLKQQFNAEMEKMDAEEVLEPWERVSAAIGAAFYDESLDNDVSSLFRRADHEMYEQKKKMKAERED
jgi:diguanylate cyclase (GGDEF)-like protein